jgi:hypothetical protein
VKFSIARPVVDSEVAVERAILASSWISAQRMRQASATEIGRFEYFFRSFSMFVQCFSAEITMV